MCNLAKGRVLVTGSGGFIGSHLTEALVDAGAEVTAMIRYTSRSDWGNLEFLPLSKKEVASSGRWLNRGFPIRFEARQKQGCCLSSRCLNRHTIFVRCTEKLHKLQRGGDY